MMDKKFLLILIKTMEEQRDFSIREKSVKTKELKSIVR